MGIFRTLFSHTALVLASGLLLTASTACDKNGHIDLLSVDDDKNLGAQTAAQIAADPTTYPLLDSATHPLAYQYLNNMKLSILSSSHFTYKDDFVWRLHIINQDSVLNAFCTPGGYIYVYSGLIKYLDKADELAGVMGHEMGHADKRHTSRQITEQQGYDLVLSVALGQNPGQLAQIASQIIQLKYSRSYEAEADEASVDYLSDTHYACNGAKYFFLKLDSAGSGTSTPVFLSDHPSDASRITHFDQVANDLHCNTGFISETGTTYADFKASLN